MSSNKWYELKIELNGVKPSIWRTFVSDSNVLLPDLHKMIQIIMGWTNSHLHQFIKDGVIFSGLGEESFIRSVNYNKIKLCEVLKTEGDSIIYEYDFGDGWEHKLQLVKIRNDIESKDPECISGERSCPPEDCGGVPGYEEILKALKNPKKKKYKGIIEWVGCDYDPDYLDIPEINERLKKKRSRILSWNKELNECSEDRGLTNL